VCGQGSPPTVSLRAIQGTALGTTWTVKWMGELGRETEVRAWVEADLERLDTKMSTWRDDSEISRLRGTVGPVEVSEETALVVKAALALAADSEGAFDPTVGPLMSLWGFTGKHRETLPSDAEVTTALRRVGHERVQVGRAEGVWRIDSVGATLDLSAIAKGTGVDWISRSLIRKEIFKS